MNTSRLKQSRQMIRLVRSIELSTSDLVYPIFVREDESKFEIPSLKGQYYLGLEDSVLKCKEAKDLGIPGVLIFGVIRGKDTDASVALQAGGFHAKIFQRLKNEFKDDLVLISNVCLCDYTHDEYCVYTDKGRVLNEKTAKMLAKIAVVHAEAGADVIAPAAMADGQVREIRRALDENGFDNVVIMSYLKTNSCLFQPFYQTMSQSEVPRIGVDSSKFRIDINNDKMFMQKAAAEISDGADIIIVKPAINNLDLILRARQQYPSIPIAAYQVSGEYSMIKAAAEKKLIDEETAIMESLNSIKRAGADMILTYNAVQAAMLLKQ